MPVPIIKLEDLPLRSLTPTTSATVPVVLDNKQTARVAWTDLITDTVRKSAEVPSSPNSAGEEGLIATAPDGLYFYANGQWRKVPAYSAYWSELTTGVRALVVDRPMTLNAQQLTDVRSTLQLGIASQTREGLVRAMTDAEAASAAGTPVKVNANGTMFVEAATGDVKGTVTVWDGSKGDVATKEYVDTHLSSMQELALPIAGVTKIGGLALGTSAGAFYVDPNTGIAYVRAAAEGSPGIVSLAADIDANDGGVLTASQVRKAVHDGIEGIGTATDEKAGLVYPWVQGAWQDGENPTTGVTRKGALYMREAVGAMDVYPAAATQPGVVMVAADVTESPVAGFYPTVPTASAVKSFVAASVKKGISDLSVVAPLATYAKPGAVLPGNTLSYDANTGLLDVPSATESSAGIINIATSIADGIMAVSAVPTVSAVITYVAALQSAVAALESKVNALRA